MQAMLFAAGLGTRLRPLTNDRPKALVELQGRTLLEHAILYLQSHGVQDFIINIHHFGQKVLDNLEAANNYGANIQISDERAALLETGGGVLHAASLIKEEHLIAWNVDVVSNIDIGEMYQLHVEERALATLATRNRQTSRYLLFDEQNQLCGHQNNKTGIIRKSRAVENVQQQAFSGIQIINRALLSKVKQRGKFSIIEPYLDLSSQEKIIAYPHDKDYWFDLGTKEKLEKADYYLRQQH